ncbi:MAG TPA: hypothetical protein VMX97_03245, partial [Hyphomicrobiaceae bacterium]|nr:hypothetical protein [Hyphomicrobiaceae bacterium]
VNPKLPFGTRELDQITHLLSSRDDLVRASVEAPEVGGMAELITRDGDVRTLPIHTPRRIDGPYNETGTPDPKMPMIGGMDGFYICRLRKRG